MKKQQLADERLRALAGLGLFKSCTQAELEALLANTDIVTVPAGNVLERSGHSARQLLGILDGYVERIPDEGRQSILGRGDWIGAAELRDRGDHRATFVASTATSLVVVFGPAFRASMGPIPTVAVRAHQSARGTDLPVSPHASRHAVLQETASCISI